MAAGIDATGATTAVVRAYFDRLERGELDAPREGYAPDARITIHGVLEEASREELAAWFEGLRDAMPDFAFAVLDVTAEGERAVVRWRATGTFAGPGRLLGFEATGAPVALEGVDVTTVRDGRLARNDAYADGMTVARQIGALPPERSRAHGGMVRAVNLRTRAARRLRGSAPEPVAEGVWVVRGGVPRTINVLLVRDAAGVLAFDAGAAPMAPDVRRAAAQLGGLTRIVLSHGHADHRGGGPALGVPILAHADAREDAEGDGGARYLRLDRLRSPMRILLPRVLIPLWDGGPVTIAGTLAEGDDVAGFRVVELPGHAPGLIGLWREADRLALASDAVYTLNPQSGRRGEPRLAPDEFNHDTEQARASLRRLAALGPATVWPAHGDVLTGDAARRLERAAALA